MKVKRTRSLLVVKVKDSTAGHVDGMCSFKYKAIGTAERAQQHKTTAERIRITHTLPLHTFKPISIVLSSRSLLSFSISTWDLLLSVLGSIHFCQEETFDRHSPGCSRPLADAGKVKLPNLTD